MNITLNSNVSAGFKTKRQKFGIGPLVFLTLLGILFIAAGLLVFKGLSVDSSWTKVQGRVVDATNNISDGATMYTPVIEYMANGKSYKITGGSSSSAYPNIGSTREVAYNPARPDQAKPVESTGSKTIILLFPLVGLILVVLAPVLFIRSMNRSKKIARLMQSGQKVQGVLIDIESNSASNSNGSNSYKLVVSATSTSGVVQNYVSDSLNSVGGLALMDYHKTPVPIDVYLDPSNPKDYYVDISDVPNLTPQRITELLKQTVTPTQSSTPVTPPTVPPASTN